MDNNIKFTVIVDKLNYQIAMLNIKISKDPGNNELNEKLNKLLVDREKLYTGTAEDLDNLTKKYGDLINE